MQTREVNQVIAKIPDWVILTQCMAFAILYAIWALPETILIRHVCLILGALLGAFVIYQYRHLLLTKTALSAWLILALFIWMSFHLFFLSNDYKLQLIEYTGIWKRTAIGFIFALGLGLALGNKTQKSYWWIIFCGLLAPSLIYLVKYFFTYYGVPHQITSPDWLQLSYGSAPFYIPKTSYVVFCSPVLAVSLGMIQKNFLSSKWLYFDNIIYFMAIALTMLIFYLEKILNGEVYGVLLILIVSVSLFSRWIFALKKLQKLIALIVLAIMFIATTLYLAKNFDIGPKATNIYADLKVVLNPDKYSQWKLSAGPLPTNENGAPVSIKYYSRLSWAYNAMGLIAKHPLGYGLIEQSFGYLAKIEWPDSNLTQSHSGWIDLTLGIGVPGIILVLLALGICMKYIKSNNTDWGTSGFYLLFALALLWLTTEVSQRVFFDLLIFDILLVTGLLLNRPILNKNIEK
jgi:hypothetical protein